MWLTHAFQGPVGDKCRALVTVPVEEEGRLGPNQSPTPRGYWLGGDGGVGSLRPPVPEACASWEGGGPLPCGK